MSWMVTRCQRCGAHSDAGDWEGPAWWRTCPHCGAGGGMGPVEDIDPPLQIETDTDL